eukprot:PhF_6_TR40527/c0_g1_i4/m.60710
MFVRRFLAILVVCVILLHQTASSLEDDDFTFFDDTNVESFGGYVEEHVPSDDDGTDVYLSPDEDVEDGDNDENNQYAAVQVHNVTYHNLRNMTGENITNLTLYENSIVLFYADWDDLSLEFLSVLNVVQPQTLQTKVIAALHHTHAETFSDYESYSKKKLPKMNLTIFAIDGFRDTIASYALSINKFPTLYYMNGLRPVREYRGPPRVKEVTAFIEMVYGATNPSTSAIRTANEFSVALNSAEVTLVAYSPSVVDANFKALDKAFEFMTRYVPVFYVFANATTSVDMYIPVLHKLPDFWRHDMTVLAIYKKTEPSRGLSHPMVEVTVYANTVSRDSKQHLSSNAVDWVEENKDPYVVPLHAMNFKQIFRDAQRQKEQGSNGVGMVILMTQGGGGNYDNHNHEFECFEILRKTALSQQTARSDAVNTATMKYYTLNTTEHPELTRRLCVESVSSPQKQTPHEHEDVVDDHPPPCQYVTIIPNHLPHVFLTDFPPVDEVDLVENHRRCNVEEGGVAPSRPELVNVSDTIGSVPFTTTTTSVLRQYLANCYDMTILSTSKHRATKEKSNLKHGAWTSTVYEHSGCATSVDDDGGEVVDADPKILFIIFMKQGCAYCQYLHGVLGPVRRALARDKTTKLAHYIHIEIVNVDSQGLHAPFTNLVEGYPEMLLLNASHIIRYEGLDRTTAGILSFLAEYTQFHIEGAGQTGNEKLLSFEKFKKFRKGVYPLKDDVGPDRQTCP